MFLIAPEYGLEDFARACGMIAPSGTTIDMIISPQQLMLPQNSGFEEQVQLEDIPEDESIVYQRTEPILKQTAAAPPPDYATWEAEKLGRTVPVPFPTPEITDPAELPSPFIKVLTESVLFGTDIQLREDWMFFPKNTIFHCVKSHIKEQHRPLRERWQVVILNKDTGKKRIVFETDSYINATWAKERFDKKVPVDKRYKTEICIRRIREGILSAAIHNQKDEEKKRHGVHNILSKQEYAGPGSTSRGKDKKELDHELEIGLIDYQEYTRKCKQLGLKESVDGYEGPKEKPKDKLARELLDKWSRTCFDYDHVDIFKKGDFWVADFLDEGLFIVKECRGDTLKLLKTNCEKWLNSLGEKYE